MADSMLKRIAKSKRNTSLIAFCGFLVFTMIGGIDIILLSWANEATYIIGLTISGALLLIYAIAAAYLTREKKYHQLGIGLMISTIAILVFFASLTLIIAGASQNL